MVVAGRCGLWEEKDCCIERMYRRSEYYTILCTIYIYIEIRHNTAQVVAE